VKLLRPFIILLLGITMAFLLLWAASIIVTVKAQSEEREERRQQETQEYIDKVVNECKWAYPLDLVSRYECYERLI
jgi:hypothetical protein